MNSPTAEQIAEAKQFADENRSLMDMLGEGAKAYSMHSIGACTITLSDYIEELVTDLRDASRLMRRFVPIREADDCRYDRMARLLAKWPVDTEGVVE